MRKALILFLLFLWISLSTVLVFAQETTKQKKLPSLVFLGEFKGPFKGTTIARVYDPQYNVMCYVYIPEAVITQAISAYRDERAITSFGGAISCVKLK